MRCGCLRICCGVGVVDHLVVVPPGIIVCIVVAIPVRCGILCLFLCCFCHVVHCYSAILCHVTMLATPVTSLCGMLSFSFHGSFVLSFVAFLCTLGACWPVGLLTFSFCPAVLCCMCRSLFLVGIPFLCILCRYCTCLCLCLCSCFCLCCTLLQCPLVLRLRRGCC